MDVTGGRAGWDVGHFRRRSVHLRRRFASRLAEPLGRRAGGVECRGQTLEIQSGTGTILADPNEVRFNGGAGDEPVITVDSGAKLEVAPTDGSLMVHIGGLTLNSGEAADVAQLEAPPPPSCPTASMSPTTMQPTMRRW